MFENLSHLLHRTKNTRFSWVRQKRNSCETVAKRATEAYKLSQEVVSRE